MGDAVPMVVSPSVLGCPSVPLIESVRALWLRPYWVGASVLLMLMISSRQVPSPRLGSSRVQAAGR
eukprot:3800900-Pyramimonas_sp.AAC.1